MYSGRVRDASTQAPIAAAKVSLDVPGAPPIFYTDTEGIFRFPLTLDDQPHAGRIRVDVDGYISYDRVITIPPNITQLEDIRLAPDVAVTPTLAPIATQTETIPTSASPTPPLTVVPPSSTPEQAITPTTSTPTLSNVAVFKPITVTVRGEQAQGGPVKIEEKVEGAPPRMNDGDLGTVMGWINEDYDERMIVEVTIDLQGSFDISQIRYTVGTTYNSQGDNWTANTMNTPLGSSSNLSGLWITQNGQITTSEVTLTFTKVRTGRSTRVLYIGEIEIYGVPTP